MLKKLRNYLWRWLVHLTKAAWLFWAALAPFVISIAVMIWAPTEPHFRWLGGFLQIVGFAITLIEVFGAKRMFGVKWYGNSIARYWATRPRWPRTQQIEATSILSTSAVGTPSFSTSRDRDTGVEARLAQIENELDELRDKLSTLQSTNQSDHERIERELDKKHRGLKGALDDISATLKDASVGTLGLRQLGIWYFVLGISLATLSVDLAGYFGD